METLLRMGAVFTHPSELPVEIRERITALYVAGLGREPTEKDLEALLGFSLKSGVASDKHSFTEKDLEALLRFSGG